VRVRDLYFVAPFANTVVTLRLRGEQIWRLLEHGVSGRQGFLQVSGVRLKYDPAQTVGQRVRAVWVGESPLDRGRLYRVATNSFLAQGGDGYSAFAEGIDRQDTGMKLLDLLVREFENKKQVSAPRGGRIIVMRGSDVPVPEKTAY